ncbi:MAG: hypothetical protein KIS29_05105 [Thermoplasmata archaeon]|nr:hypothetical protein [Candidatus Sysuiplasma jiujiangense]
MEAEGYWEAVGLTQQAVAQHLQEIPKTVKLVKSAFHEGKDIETIADDMKLDLLVTYALLLQDEEDFHRFPCLG